MVHFGRARGWVVWWGCDHVGFDVDCNGVGYVTVVCGLVCVYVCVVGPLHLASTFVVFGVSFAVPCRPVVGGWYFFQ